MDFIDQIRELAEQALDSKEVLETEEATKNALIMPFIRLLGYNVFDPREVVPEYTADVGIKRGEKVDYAICKDGVPQILFECKAAGVDLDKEHASQLFRYFSAIREVRFGVLTNGIAYRFFSDIEAENRMDDKPFLELNLLDIRESLVEQLKKFTKDNFDVADILSTASELKYTREIKHILAAEYESPTADFVRFCIANIYSRSKTQIVIERFAPFAKRAFHQFVNDRINERLKSALEGEVAPVSTLDSGQSNAVQDDEDREGDEKIVTTEEEWEAFFAVKSMLYGVVDLSRVTIRDRISYCGILLDDNGRKPICRLHFNGPKKYLGTFDAGKKETRIPIDSVNDIYQYADQLKFTCQTYDGTASEEI